MNECRHVWATTAHTGYPYRVTRACVLCNAEGAFESAEVCNWRKTRKGYQYRLAAWLIIFGVNALAMVLAPNPLNAACALVAAGVALHYDRKIRRKP